MFRFTRRLLAVLILIASAAIVSAQPAQALDLLTCAGATTITYDPALTNQDQITTVTNQADYGPCVSTTHPQIEYGSVTNTAVSQTSCIKLLAGGSRTFTITWNGNPDTTSTFSGTYSTQSVGLTRIITIVGTVTAGVFEGDNFVHQTTVPATELLACTLGLGTVSGFSGPIQLVIFGS
jgi:hypothetical protein